MFVIIEELLTQFRHADRVKREQRGRAVCDLGIDLGRDLFCLLARRGNFASDSLFSLAEVEPPGSVVQIDSDLADTKAVSITTGHVQLLVQTFCTKFAPEALLQQNENDAIST